MTDTTQPEEQPPACVPTWDTTDPLQQEVTRVLKSFKLDIMGIIHLGKDGILRSLTADRKVLSAAALTLEQIEAFHNRFPADFREQMEVKRVDGTNTAKEKWFEPDEGILPAPLPQEHIDEVLNMSEEGKERLRKRMRENERSPRIKRERASSTIDPGLHANVDEETSKRVKLERDSSTNHGLEATKKDNEAVLSASSDCSPPLKRSLPTTLREPTRNGSKSPTLLSLPGELRNRIYNFLVPGNPLKLGLACILSRGLPLKQQNNKFSLDPHQRSDYASLTRICRKIRTEFYSYLLGHVDITIDIQLVHRYANCFDRAFRHCKASLIITFNPYSTGTCSELLPVVRLSNEAPNLIIGFISSRKPHPLAFDLKIGQDLDYFIELCRRDRTWRHYLDMAVTTVNFYPQNRFEANVRNHILPYEPCLHIEFVRGSKEVWMSGTHNFEDLEAFLTKTGLNCLTTVDVRVGLASMANKQRGKGLRTQEQRDAIDWLLGRSAEAPNF